MRSEKRSTSIVILAMAAALGVPTAGVAQTAGNSLAAALGEPDVAAPLSDDEINPDKLDWHVLSQPTLLWPGEAPPAAPKRVRPVAVPAPSTTWKRNERPDGSAAVTLGTELPTDWETRVGMDVGIPADPAAAPVWTAVPPTLYGSRAIHDNGSGAAWANLTTPRTLGLGAAFETRVDPTQEQGRLATTFSQTTPLGGGFALTLQNGYAMTQTVPGTASAAPTVSATAHSALAVPSQVWSTERLARFNVLSTGTSFAVGAKTSTTDTGWERSLSAEQKLTDHFSVTGAVTETPTGELSKSLKGGLKFSW